MRTNYGMKAPQMENMFIYWVVHYHRLPQPVAKGMIKGANSNNYLQSLCNVS